MDGVNAESAGDLLTWSQGAKQMRQMKQTKRSGIALRSSPQAGGSLFAKHDMHKIIFDTGEHVPKRQRKRATLQYLLLQGHHARKQLHHANVGR